MSSEPPPVDLDEGERLEVASRMAPTYQRVTGDHRVVAWVCWLHKSWPGLLARLRYAETELGVLKEKISHDASAVLVGEMVMSTVASWGEDERKLTAKEFNMADSFIDIYQRQKARIEKLERRRESKSSKPNSREGKGRKRNER